jgi:hypothetical protein
MSLPPIGFVMNVLILTRINSLASMPLSCQVINCSKLNRIAMRISYRSYSLCATAFVGLTFDGLGTKKWERHAAIDV